MIAKRDVKLLSIDEITNYLCDAGLDGYLTKTEFQEIMAELERRELHPEVLAGLMGFGKPEWYKDRLQIVMSPKTVV
jgi:hypothetical protein